MAQRGAHEAPGLAVSSIIQVASAASSIVSYGIVLFLSWPVMLALLMASAIPMTIVERRLARRNIEVAREVVSSYRWASYYEQLVTSPEAARELRVQGVHIMFAERLRENLSFALVTQARQQSRASAAQGGLAFVSGVVAGLGAAAVAAAAFRHRVTVGDYVLFTTAVVAVQGQVGSLLNLGGAMATSLGTFRRYLAVIGQLAKSTEQSGAGSRALPALQSIEFVNVWFRYPSTSSWALRGVNLKFDAGGAYALVGENGAGKSTVIALLFRLYEPAAEAARSALPPSGAYTPSCARH